MKSDNIFCMLDENNEIKECAIADFDTALFLQKGEYATATSGIAGTPGNFLFFFFFFSFY